MSSCVSDTTQATHFVHRLSAPAHHLSLTQSSSIYYLRQTVTSPEFSVVVQKVDHTGVHISLHRYHWISASKRRTTTTYLTYLPNILLNTTTQQHNITTFSTQTWKASNTVIHSCLPSIHTYLPIRPHPSSSHHTTLHHDSRYFSSPTHHSWLVLVIPGGRDFLLFGTQSSQARRISALSGGAATRPRPDPDPEHFFSTAPSSLLPPIPRTSRRLHPQHHQELSQLFSPLQSHLSSINTSTNTNTHLLSTNNNNYYSIFSTWSFKVQQTQLRLLNLTPSPLGLQ
ncbi:hypothetical protein VTL71DRAFT_15015 [Oculimacula yallundae]|uniref:Uncharacterized protein n=1 Tax=Oculimacula yallundae TaxID=86028 RepID=A0ABR4CFD2_9HELO